MIELNNIKCISIDEFLNIYNLKILTNLISAFRCDKNLEIEEYLKRNAIEFNKKHQAMTFILLDNKNKINGYFSLSIKPITIKKNLLSKNRLKKLLRIANLTEEENEINPSAYLIAQLGKLSHSNLNIDTIFAFINYYISEAQKICGGVVEFLESENNQKLINMYTARGFRIFNARKSTGNQDRKLIQMYRLI